MSTVHFLNVREGDCTLIQHGTGRNTVIDICCGRELSEQSAFASLGNFHQKEHPVNPISYIEEHGVEGIFRFILTHPDMDHMDGLKALYDAFPFPNFWDTANTKKMDEKEGWGRYKQEDWDFYQRIRLSSNEPKALNLYANAQGQYYNRDETGAAGGDGLFILSPTKELVEEANRTGNFNDCSYVLLYQVGRWKIIFAGDSEEKTWDHILDAYQEEVSDVDVLIAPHHGRKTGGNTNFLDVLKPKLTLFGNAKSKDLAYDAWLRRGLWHITNNQAGCIILNVLGDRIDVYVTYEGFARKENPSTHRNDRLKAWFLKSIR